MSDSNGLCIGGYSLLSLSCCIVVYEAIYCGAFYSKVWSS